MDNPNDQNSSNNPNYPPAKSNLAPATSPSGAWPPAGGSAPSFGTPSQPLPDLGNLEPTTPPPPPSSSDPMTGGSTTEPMPLPPPPIWPSTPPPVPPPAPTWPPGPIQPDPTTPLSAMPPSDTWPTSQPEPSPTFTPPPPAKSDVVPAASPPSVEPTGSPTSETTPESNSSPLDNPWGAPSQTPPLSQSPSTTQPSWTNIPGNQPENQTVNPSSPEESAPTDLSHLISNNQPEPVAPETLVAPSTTPTPDVPTLPAETHKSIPKWLIGLGVGLLILVVGASAYFILGIGQTPKETTSLPATTTSKTAEVKLPPPIATPTAQPAATESANFGQLGGSSGETQATSAADLLRQRQGR